MWWALYRGLRVHLGEWRYRAKQAAKMRWMRRHRWPDVCENCKRRVPWKERTIDHIIPQSVCFELDLPGLLFDDRNFQMLCSSCNSEKGHDIESLPEAIKKELERRRALIKS